MRNGADPARVVADAPPQAVGPAPRRMRHGRLFQKYLLLILSLVTGALLVSGGVSIYFSYQEQKAAIGDLQHEDRNLYLVQLVGDSGADRQDEIGRAQQDRGGRHAGPRSLRQHGGGRRGATRLGHHQDPARHRSAALRVPVIAERSPLTQHYVAAGITGLLLAPGDASYTASAVAAFLSVEEKRVAMGNAGRTRVQRDFAETATIDGFEQAVNAAGDRTKWATT